MARSCPTYSIQVTFSPSIGSQLTAKNPGQSRGQTASDRLAVLLLSALALSALTALLSALSGLLLLLAWLLLAAAALLLARLVLAALLLAGVLLVRIVHNFSYFGSSP
jgi:Flp pilus assembly protein TadB